MKNTFFVYSVIVVLSINVAVRLHSGYLTINVLSYLPDMLQGIEMSQGAATGHKKAVGDASPFGKSLLLDV